jgi:two-component system CitB family sensor kinase
MTRRHPRWSIAARLFALQVVVIVLIAALAAVWTIRTARTDADSSAARACLALATGVADNPFVLDALTTTDPSARLQPYALDLMRDTSTDFVTIMTPDRTRLTHPDPAEIGRPFVGTIEPALEGRSFTETYTGTLGPSVRAVVPVRSAGGEVVALVSAGVTVSAIADTLEQRLALVLAAAATTVLLGALASWLLSRYLGRVTRGRGPEELGRLFDYYEGVLHSVREGLLLVDDRGRLTLYNDQAAELLGLPPGGVDRPVPLDGLALPDSLARLLVEGRRADDEVHVTDDRVLVVNQQRTGDGSPGGAGRPDPARTLGTVTTLRDRTELTHLAGEVESMRTLADALRSQTHEFSNRLHTIVSLIELGRTDEALSFAATGLDVDQRLADSLIHSVEEPALAALLLGKTAQARERGVDLVIDVDPGLGALDVEPRDLVTVLGNLLDNALDAAEATVRVTAWRDAGDVVFEVADDGPGLGDVEQAFHRGFSTKEAGSTGRGVGLALVRQAVSHAGGGITVTTGADGTVFSVRFTGAVVAAGRQRGDVGGGRR